MPRWLKWERPEQEASDHDCCLDPRFASGQIFTPHVLGAMVACEYRMPGIIEMTHILMAPHPDHGNAESKPRQTDKSVSFLWQIRMKKEHDGATYAQVFSDLLRDTFNPALPLGILRNFDDEKMGLGYVWTNPAPETRMLASDLIFVLADSVF